MTERTRPYARGLAEDIFKAGGLILLLQEYLKTLPNHGATNPVKMLIRRLREEFQLGIGDQAHSLSLDDTEQVFSLGDYGPNETEDTFGPGSTKIINEVSSTHMY